MSEQNDIVKSFQESDNAGATESGQMKNSFNQTHDDVKQIIYGALLGSGYVCRGRKNDYFCMRHSQRHGPWLRTKAAELTEFASNKAFYEYKTTITWRSSCHPFFTHLRSRLYQEDQKIITMEWLDQLRDLAIAVWFGDSGCMTGRGQKNACLRTQSFGKEGNQIIEQYFNEVGIPCAMNKSRESFVIVFSVEGTRNLFRLIANSLPSPRLLKLLPFHNIKI